MSHPIMHHGKFFKFTFILFVGLIALNGKLAAQNWVAPGVEVKISASGDNGLQVYSQLRISGAKLPSSPTGTDGSYAFSDSFHTGAMSTGGTVRLEPDKVYMVVAQCSFYSGNFKLDITSAANHQIELDGVLATSSVVPASSNGGSYSHTYFLRIRSPRQNFSDRAGAATSIASNKLYWQVSLGSLQNGSSAGALALIDSATAVSWTSVVSPAGLQYETTTPEVVIYRDANGYIKQIVADQAAVNVVTNTSIQYDIKFYHPQQLVGSTFPFTFTGLPYVTYRVEQGANDNALKITKYTCNITSPTDTTTAVVAKAATSLARSGTWPNFTWTRDDWNSIGASQLVEEIRTPPAGGNGANRTETVTLKVPGGAVASTTTDGFTQFAWGEERTSHSDGTLSTTSSYVTNPAFTGSYSFVAATVSSGGQWTAYDYWDASASHASPGTIKYRFRPFNASPSSVTLDPALGEVTYYEYSADPFGAYGRPALIQTKVNNVMTGKSVITYSNVAGVNGQTVVQAVRQDYSDNSSHFLTTTTKYYIESCPDAFLRNQVHSVLQPTGAKTSFAYLHGTYDETAHTFTAGAGAASCTAQFSGSSNSAAGLSYTTYGSYTLDSLYLVDGKSTLTLTMRDARALVRRTESYAWSVNGSGVGSWNLVSFVNFDYSYSGQLTSRVASNGGTYSASYDGDQKTSETEETGITVSYTYDAAGRVLSAVKTNGPTTTMAYNAAGRVLSTTLSNAATTETIVASALFDDGGRQTSQTPPGLGATTYSYSYSVAGAAWSSTATAPATTDAAGAAVAGATAINTYQIDGQLLSVTGTGVVPQYYTYGVETDGRRFVQVNSGSSSSSRLQKSWVDWLGRTVQSQQPGFSQSLPTAQPDIVTQNTYDFVTGLLTKTTRTGFAPTLYAYNVLGQLNRTGLDVSGDGSITPATANTTDRITDQDTVFEFYSGSWWLKTTSKTYPFIGGSAGNAITTSVSRTRLTGYTGSLQAEAQSTDAENNTVISTTSVNRSTATVTSATTAPGFSNTQSTTMVNGLVTSSTGMDHLTSSNQYDALGRPWKSTDTRSKVTTVAYVTGTTMPYTVTDAAGNVVTTNQYDAAGRLAWTRDAASHYTRYAYNPRSQPTNQWGDGTYPVSYGYDLTYGDRTSMSTYRAAPAADSATWPTVGTADTTTWTFDTPTGLSWKKTSAAVLGVSTTVQLDYNLRGGVSSRQLARNLTATTTPIKVSYGYDANTGELLTQTYNDGAEAIPTPAVTYTYTRSGQVKTIVDGSCTGADSHTFNYDASLPWRLNSETLPATFFGSRLLTRNYDATSSIGAVNGYGSYTPGTTAGRYSGFSLGITGDVARDLQNAYTIDSYSTNLVGVSPSSTQNFIYSYAANSHLLNGYTVGSNFAVSRQYDPNLNLVSQMKTAWGAGTLTQFDYTYSNLYQRTTARQSGTAFADYYSDTSLGYNGVYNVYGYNARGELQSTAMYGGNTPTTTPATSELPGRHFEYRYDSIGNRVTSGKTGSAGTNDDEYATNARNQYSTRENNLVSILGTAAKGASVAVAGYSGQTKNGCAWGADILPANSSSVVQGTATIYASMPGAGSGGADVFATSVKNYLVPPASQDFTYDADGNLITDTLWSYTYDAENRLVAMQNLGPAIGAGKILTTEARRLVFLYDYMGRRVEKKVFAGWNGTGYSTTAMKATRYIYDGWNVIAELDATATSLTRSYTWGLDLTGDLTSTGGVGALVQIYDSASAKTFYPTYDGNGNIVSLINASTGSFAAVYEYDPYGNYLRAEVQDSAMQDNPFRFSTKYTDTETGLVYYGKRYYSPSLGRFINQDPIAESGGLNLYGFCGNNGLNHFDVLGNYEYVTILDKNHITYGGRTWYTTGPIDAYASLFESWGQMSHTPGFTSGATGSSYGLPSGVDDIRGDPTANVYTDGDSGGWGDSKGNSVAAPLGSALDTTSSYNAAAPIKKTEILSSTKNSDGSITYHTTTGDYTVTPRSNSNFNAEGLDFIGGAHVDLVAPNRTESQIYIVAPDASGQLVHTAATAQQVVALARSQGGSVDVFQNGQSNDINKAIRNGSMQLNGATSFVLFYNPTHGGLLDTFESAMGRLTGTSQVGREFGNFLSATSSVNVNLVVHSQGGITANIGMNQVLSQGGSLPNLSIHYNGAAVNEMASRVLVSNVGANFDGFSINRGDSVPLLIGGNAQNLGQVLLGIMMLPSTITGIGSQHSNYAPTGR